MGSWFRRTPGSATDTGYRTAAVSKLCIRKKFCTHIERELFDPLPCRLAARGSGGEFEPFGTCAEAIEHDESNPKHRNVNFSS